MKRIMAVFCVFLMMSFAGVVTAQTSVTTQLTTNVDIATYDVSNGFNKEVQLDSLTRLEWTLVNGDGTYLYEVDIPGKQLPATGWVDFYNELGWTTSHANALPIQFSNGAEATLYAEVIGNSGKVRFWIEIEEPVEGEVTEDIKNVNVVEKETEKSIIIEIVKGVSEYTKSITLTFNTTIKGTWYVWVNGSTEAIVTTDLEVTIGELMPGTHHLKIELVDEDGQVVEEYEETVFIPTNDGGVLPNTATPWYNLLLSGMLLVGLGLFARKVLGSHHVMSNA